MKSLIKKLVEVPGPSGYETKIREVVRSEVEPLVDEMRVDNLGNLITRIGQKTAKGLRIMLVAHIDEIGVMVTHVDKNGFVRFTTLGGVFPQSLRGKRVHFLNGEFGVIGNEGVFRTSGSATIEKFYIDVGATSQKDCPVRIGDVAAFDRSFIDLGRRIVSKAMDDRVGVAVLIETLRQIRKQKISTPHEIYFVFSTQEEVGVRGATGAAYGIDPDIGLAVDVAPTGDTPKGLKMDVALGGGPAIKVRDRSMLSDPRIVNWMVETAQKAGLPYQMEILELGGTDARAIQLTRAGVPAGCLSIPCRYVHSPSEMVDIYDIKNSVSLLTELLRKPVQL